MMIQWISATLAKKELIYYCFGDEDLAMDMKLIVDTHGSKNAGSYFS
jgi:Poly (ADP-ribose) glycohydrolase (PARG)